MDSIFAVYDNKIWRWDNCGNNWYSIADITDPLSCRKLVGMACMLDKVSDNPEDAPAIVSKLWSAIGGNYKDICPTLKEEDFK